MKTPARCYILQTSLFSTAYNPSLLITTRQLSIRSRILLRPPSRPALALIPTRPCSTSVRRTACPSRLDSRRRGCIRQFCAPSLPLRIRKLACAAPSPARHSLKKLKRLESQVFPALYIASVVAVGAFLAYEFILGGSGTTVPLDKNTPGSKIFKTQGEMEVLPGRPGNLTPEEEEKLRKFWEMFLHVCGVIDEEASAETESSTTTTTTTTQEKAAEPEKSKKKRLGLFKKKKDKNKDATASGKAPGSDIVKENDPEDKWGENKAYHETLAKHPPEEIRSTIWSMVKHDHPDALLLRFLRARKWDLQKALVMLISTMDWRKSQMHVDDDIMVKGEEYALLNATSSDPAVKKSGEDFLAQLRLGKSYCYGIDKSGRAINIVRARLHRAGEQSEESLERFTVYLIETARHLLAPPADTACVVFDLTGFSLANMDYTPVKFMIKCFEANYPESLGIVLVHKAPWVFQGIWKIVRGWLDPVVASKVHFTNNLQDLEEFILPERIPEDMEGKSGWNYEYVDPVPGENDRMKDVETRDRMLQEREGLYDEYESRTLEWINEGDFTKRADINALRNEAATKLRESYWRLDPYVRSRSLYDRLGVIKSDGTLDYYPAAASKAEPATTNGISTSAATEKSADDDVD